MKTLIIISWLLTTLVISATCAYIFPKDIAPLISMIPGFLNGWIHFNWYDANRWN